MRQRQLRLGAALLALASILWVSPAQGLDAEAECPPLHDAQSLLDCIRLRHPDLRLAAMELNLGETRIREAAQRLNPELESRVLFGVGDHDSPALSETNFLQPFELGGKRKARVAKARAELQSDRASARSRAEKIVLKTVLRLHRLRQLRSEQGTLRETAATYRRIVRLYRGRPLLSPEQESSLVIFEAAMSETQLQELDLKNEASGLMTELELTLGEKLPDKDAWLPAAPKSWPERGSPSSPPESSAKVQTAKSEIEVARASKRLAQSEAWPTLRLGPSLETDSPLGNTQTAVGFAFSTDIPLLHRNQGGKARARQEERMAELKLQREEKRASMGMERWSQEYARNRAAWLRSSHANKFKANHHRLENLFESGLIPGTLLLEAHRQLIDFEQQRNRTELKTIEAWWRILALEGKILEAKI